MSRPLPLPTIEEVREAYRVTGLTPTRSVTYNAGRACALGAVATARGLSVDLSDIKLAFGVAAAESFMAGFDGVGRHWLRDAYEHGCAVAKAIFGEAA
jgi:hypothetical protein